MITVTGHLVPCFQLLHPTIFLHFIEYFGSSFCWHALHGYFSGLCGTFGYNLDSLLFMSFWVGISLFVLTMIMLYIPYTFCSSFSDPRCGALYGRFLLPFMTVFVPFLASYTCCTFCCTFHCTFSIFRFIYCCSLPFRFFPALHSALLSAYCDGFKVFFVSGFTVGFVAPFPGYILYPCLFPHSQTAKM